jgi:hypothetical protein
MIMDKNVMDNPTKRQMELASFNNPEPVQPTPEVSEQLTTVRTSRQKFSRLTAITFLVTIILEASGILKYSQHADLTLGDMVFLILHLILYAMLAVVIAMYLVDVVKAIWKRL